MARRIVVLGATGSIGRQSLDCIRYSTSLEQPLELAGFSVHTSVAAVASILHEWPEAIPAVTGTGSPVHSRWITGPDAIERLLDVTMPDMVVNGIAGAEGLRASIAVLARGIHLALANKESVVMGHALLRSLADRHGASILPVDSEHAALFQLITRVGAADIEDLIITASGGPFRTLPLEQLANVTPEDAIRHPTWRMGRKISIDSATMANKGLELIEAVKLFGMPEQRVRVVIHPQSHIHAMVQARDGAMYAHLSAPDMRLPILDALYWPKTVSSPYGRIDFSSLVLEFSLPEPARYPMLFLAREAIQAGDAACIAYNASNEIAVAAFDQGRIPFPAIAATVSNVLEEGWDLPIHDFDDIFRIDSMARKSAHRVLGVSQ